MSIELMRHKTDPTVLLRYDAQRGPVSEISEALTNTQPRKKAVYERHENGFIGVIGTSSGPALFINSKLFPFSDSSWSVKLEEFRDHNECIILQNGREEFKAKYVKPRVDDLDPWSDDESEDFYAWLAAKRNDDEFFEMWSVM